MDIGSIFLILALLTLVALFISRPFFESRRPAGKSQASQQISVLMAEQDRILNALSELDFDDAVGKIPEEDYPSQRTALLQSGVEVLRQLDQLQAASPATLPIESAEERLESAVVARRAATAAGRQGGNGNHTPDDNLEVLIAARRRARQEKSAGFCPQCGSPVQLSDRFCPRCGATLQSDR